MEAPISKFIHVQQSGNEGGPEYWHLTPNTSAFKSPDLIELTDPVEPLNYSSSQEEVETEDDGEVPESIKVKEGIPGVVYDVTSNDEESCHLLQTEDDSENSDSEQVDSSKSSASRSSSSAEATISDGEAPEERINSRLRHCSLDNYWDMSLEQEKYYTEQFLLLQPDPLGMVSGAVAKGFFEKSKLPHTELREIWQIADVTRDGCLDLAEFKTAMHLVVLRRHGLHIPSHIDSRPLDFHSLSSNINNLPGPATGSEPNANPSSSVAQQLLTTPPTRSNNNIIQAASSAPPQHVDRISKKQLSKDWTTFENEHEIENDPNNFSSLVQFTAECDTSGLVAPVVVPMSSCNRCRLHDIPNRFGLTSTNFSISPPRLTTPEDKLFASNSTSVPKSQHLQLKAIQRPKLSGHHPKISASTIAPPPPPRRKTHVRSSSLDLNRLNGEFLGPEVPARFLSPSHQGGAFSVYRKPQQPSTTTIHEPSSVPHHVVSSKATKVQLKQEVSDLKNENTILNRISTQLLDQLSGLQAKKKALTCKILQLNTLSSGGRIS